MKVSGALSHSESGVPVESFPVRREMPCGSVSDTGVPFVHSSID